MAASRRRRTTAVAATLAAVALTAGLTTGCAAVDKALAEGWPIERVDATLRAILRAAAFELLRRRDIPAKVVITEYIDVARAFYEDDATGLVNAALDSIAKTVPAQQ